MKKRFLTSLIIVSFILSLIGCSNVENSNHNNSITSNTSSKNIKGRELSNEEWISDIDLVYETLIKNHSLFKNRYEDKKLKEKIDSLKKEVANLNDTEINLRLTEIAASIGDCHTMISCTRIMPSSWYPIKLWWFCDELRVIDATEEYKDIINCKLTAINDIPIRKVMDKIDTLVPQVNKQYIKTLDRGLVHRQILEYFKIIEDSAVKFTFEDDNDNIKNVIIKHGSTYNFHELRTHELLSKYTNLPQNNENMYLPYWFKYIPEDKILYFKYNECLDKTVADYGYHNFDFNSYPRFDEFFHKIIQCINENDVDKFIIDMRGNNGGLIGLLSDELDKLDNNNKWNQNIKKPGHLFVLIDKGCASAAIENTSYLRFYEGAITVGEPMGDRIDISYLNPKVITLPNSKISLSYSTESTEIFEEFKEVLNPDILVEESFESYLKGIDDVYEAVKNYKND